METISPEEFTERMKHIKDSYSHDLECRHVHMDELMCEVLTSLGYEGGVKIFENTEMWYA